MATQRQKNVKKTVGKGGNFRSTKSGAGMTMMKMGGVRKKK